MNKKQVNEIIAKALRTDEGRTKLAQAMFEPIRRRRYSGLWDKNWERKRGCVEVWEEGLLS